MHWFFSIYRVEFYSREAREFKMSLSFEKNNFKNDFDDETFEISKYKNASFEAKKF